MKARIWFAAIVVVVVVVAGAASYVVLSGLTSRPPAALPAASTCVPAAPGGKQGDNETAGNWTTYHGDGTRTGYEPSGAVISVRATWGSPTSLDGQVYAEPLVCGNVVYVATENNSIYAINATSGATLWRTHLGPPVNGSALPCGDINPSGITGTPVIDVPTRTIYAVAFLNPTHHVLFGLDIDNGTVTSQAPADASGALPDVEQQRGALALDDGRVYIPYGGLAGDCGAYHGWVVGVPTNGTGGNLSYQVPTGREGGIWAPAGISVASDGDLYVATGNSEATVVFDFGDSVIELSPQLTVLSYFAPTNWAQLNANDVDLGSAAPAILPNGEIFQIGKQGIGYLLSGSGLGGIGGQIFDASVCGGGAYAGTAQVPGALLVPCTDGIYALSTGTTSFAPLWHSESFDAGAPIVTGDVAWAVDIDDAQLLGFNLSTGQQAFEFPLGTVDHFITPVAAPGALFVAGGSELFAFTLGGP